MAELAAMPRNVTWSIHCYVSVVVTVVTMVTMDRVRSTHINLFFLQHGYYSNLGNGIQLDDLHFDVSTPRSPQEVGEMIVSKLRAGVEMAQASIAAVQERQEE